MGSKYVLGLTYGEIIVSEHERENAIFYRGYRGTAPLWGGLVGGGLSSSGRSNKHSELPPERLGYF